jgi:hypothetical protein
MEKLISFEQLAAMKEVDLYLKPEELDFDAAMRSRLLDQQILKAESELNKKLEADLQRRLEAGEVNTEDLLRDYAVVEWVETCNMNVCLNARVVKKNELPYITTGGIVRTINHLLENK